MKTSDWNRHTLFIHSNIGYFGKLDNLKNKDQLYKFFDVLMDIIGNGTIIVPTFTYSFQKEVFDPRSFTNEWVYFQIG